ncbi:MAG: tetratricopeptide repeat protein [Verrucomicrobia bacterium]|nr:tetratricopeptide repeat protein [Verrucomicrobiota bacterium]
MKLQWLAAVCAALLAAGPAAAAETHSSAELWRTGSNAFRDGIYDVAERQLRELLTAYPRFSNTEEATLLLGETLVLSGQSEAALQWLTAALGKCSAGRFADAFVFWHGEALARVGRWKEADARYRELLEKFPTSRYVAQAQYGLGYALFTQGNFSEADSMFASISPKFASRELLGDAALMRGRIALMAKDYGTAESHFMSVTERFANLPVGWQAFYWLGQLRREQHNLEGAAAAFDKALAGSRAAPALSALATQTWLALGEVRVAQQRWTEAATAFRGAFARSASEAVKRSAVSQLNALAPRMARSEDAIALLRAFVNEHMQDALTTPVLLRLGQMLAAAKQHEEALEFFQRLAAHFPQSEEAAAALSGAAWSQLALGRVAESANGFAQVVRVAKDPALLVQAYFKLGDLAFAAGDFPKAADHYEKALNAQHRGPLAGEALWQLALSAAQAGQADRSAAALEKFLATYPQDPHTDEAWLQLGQAYVAQSRYEKAWLTFEKLWVGREPGKLAMQARLAAAAARDSAGRWLEAAQNYDEILALKPAEGVAALALFERAHCLARAGDEVGARQGFERVLKEFPKTSQAVEAVFWLAHKEFNRKEWAEAQKLFATVPQRWPGHRLADSALLWSARAALNRQAYKEARDILEELLQNPAYRSSPWRADARMLEAESLAEEGKFAEALLVFESVMRDFPDTLQADESLGRQGDCHYSLATEIPANPKLERYQKAIVAYQQVLNSLRVNNALKTQARYKIGKCYEKLGETTRALESYLAIIYETNAQGQIVAEPVWFARAGFDAGELLESQGRWAEAAKVYLRLMKSGFPCNEQARQRLEKIRASHPEAVSDVK